MKANLLDIEHQRLERMEKGGTEFSILSLNSPAFSACTTRSTPARWRGAPTTSAEQVARHRARLGGFAALRCRIPTPRSRARALRADFGSTASW